MIQLPDNRKCFNLPEQVAQNLKNITYLAEVFATIDELPAVWQTYKEQFDEDQNTFSGWTTTFEGWETTLATYLANMSSAAVSAIAGQNIAPAQVNATSSISAPSITGDSIIENMSGYTFTKYGDTADYTFTLSYAGICKNGNKITFVVAGQITKLQAFTGQFQIGTFTMPSSIGSNLYPYSLSPFTDIISASEMTYWKTYDVSQAKKHSALFRKSTNTLSYLIAYVDSLEVGVPYIFRYEITFLLSENLAS